MRALVIFLAVALLACVLAIVVWNVRDETAAVLPNGMRVEFLAVRVGGATFTTEKSWHKFARRILPARWQRWIPPTSAGSCSSGTNSVTVYLRVTDPSGRAIVSQPWREYSAMDSKGFVHERTGGYCSFGGVSNSLLYGLTLRALPRRDRDFIFRLHDTNGTLATFRIPNPVSGPFAEWTPSPLPQTKTNGPVALTLVELGAAGGPPARYVKPKWKLASNDRAWTNARARYATLLDATGNEGQMLSPREPAWKVRTFVHREKDVNFGPADRLTVTNLPIPKPGEFAAIDQSAIRHGVTLNFQVVAGPGELVVSNGVRSMSPNKGKSGGHSTSQFGASFIETWGHTNHFILIEALDMAMDDEIQIQLTDADGRKVTLRESGYNSRGRARTYQRSFTPPQSATNLALDVIVSRPLIFEFLVNPQDLKQK